MESVEHRAQSKPTVTISSPKHAVVTASTLLETAKKGKQLKPPPKAQSQFEELVDELEIAFSLSLSTYRREAEDHLMKHLQRLESLRAASDLDFAQLVVENTMLRERLGLKPTEQLQTVCFQKTPTTEPMQKSRRHKSRVGGDEDTLALRAKSDHSALSYRNQKAKSDAPGGTWQPFIAWVPNGAALQNPEPWKPLPHQDIMGSIPSVPSVTSERRAKRQNTSPSGKLHMVLPGSCTLSDVSDQLSDSDGQSEMTVKAELTLLDVWQPSRRTMKHVQSKSTRADNESVAASEVDQDEFLSSNGEYFWILSPDSTKRIAWDLSSVFMVLYDTILVPMIAFNLPETAFSSFMDWTTRLFWTFDIGWSCCTGFVLDDGTIEYDPRAILHKYVKTWLCLDLFIVASDYTGLIISSGGVQFSKLARVFRVVRVVRLLRLVRMQEIVASIMDRIHSDHMAFVLSVFKLTLLLIFICHFTACGWWGVGSRYTTQNSWVKVAGFVDEAVENQYLVSLHWALLQFAGGFCEVVPASGIERLYAVVVFVFSFVLSLIMVSALTSSITQQYIIGGSGARQLATLKRYLKQNKVSKNLSTRLCRNAKHAISGDLTPESVELLSMISEPLKVQMHFEMYSQVLCLHPFFKDLFGQEAWLARQICHQAMSVLLLAGTDVAFSLGEEPAFPKMYVVLSGSLVYADSYGEKTEVVENDYISEASLWTNWRHRGTLTATNDVKMALLSAVPFQTICKQHFRKNVSASLLILGYAADFMAEMNKLSYPSDLPSNS